MTDELPATVAVLASAYRRSRDPLRPFDVVEAYLAAIEQRDSDVRAYTTVTADRARAAARAAARRLADGDPSPLLGVPLAVKDLIDVRGVPTTAGSRVLDGKVAQRDAPAWARLRRAGAVLLGKANTHEFAYGGTTDPTRNPWALDRIVGGSSGGPGAAVAAGLCAAALGTDTAGSVRIPASLCGVYGFKPTNGAISAAGVIPLAPTLDVVGPLARTVEDIELLFAALARVDADAARAATAALRRDAVAGRLRIGVVAGPGAMTAGVRIALDRVAAAAAVAGLRPTEVEIAALDGSVWVNFTLLGVEAAEWHARYADRRELYTPYVRERLEEAAATTALAHREAVREVPRLRAAIDRALDDVDALLLPGVPFPAPLVGTGTVDVGGVSEARDVGLCRITAFANVTGHPVLAVPAGFEDGMPVGVQLVGRRGGDLRLLALGRLIGDQLDVPTLAPMARQRAGGAAS